MLRFSAATSSEAASGPNVDSHLLAAKQARRGVELVRKRLLSPTPGTIEQCAAPLSDAIECMEQIQVHLRNVPPGSGASVQLLRGEIRSLRGDLTTVTALLQSAAAFYEGYGRLLGTASDESVDYGCIGRTPPPEPARRFTVHG